MKKLAFMFVAVLAISFASCGDAPKKAEAVVDSIATAAEEVVEAVDSTVDTLAAQADSAVSEVVK